MKTVGFWGWVLDLESGVVGWCGGGDPANAVGDIGGFGIGGVIGAGGVGETFVCGEFGDAAVVWGSWAGAAGLRVFGGRFFDRVSGEAVDGWGGVVIGGLWEVWFSGVGDGGFVGDGIVGVEGGGFGGVCGVGLGGVKAVGGLSGVSWLSAWWW